MSSSTASYDNDAGHFPSRILKRLTMGLRPVLVDEDSETASHYPAGRRLRNSASFATPSAVDRASSAKAASTSDLWSL
jgi:hypothetical protein